MNQFTLGGDSVAANLTGLASNATGAAFTLTATSSADSLAHKVTVRNDSATDHSGKTIALVGTNANGQPQTETLTGPAGSATVTSAKYWLTLTSATPSATIGADTFDIGWAAASVSPWQHLNGAWSAIGFDAIVDSGTPGYSVQHTFDGGVTAFNHADVATETTSQFGAYTTPIQALRLIWTAAGGVTLHGRY